MPRQVSRKAEKEKEAAIEFIRKLYEGVNYVEKDQEEDSDKH